MKHLGDITYIDGSKIDSVDVIVGGSPCQNLSFAGNRMGLSGSESSLFYEQMRVVKEMRKSSGKPRFFMWENVRGAFSSNGGRDFRVVLTEIARVKDERIPDVPFPSGRWSDSGLLLGREWSVAWRLHDAQFWGVPQRRERLCVLADFDGYRAGDILFGEKLEHETGQGDFFKNLGYPREESRSEVFSECEGLSWDIESRREQREETARLDESSTRESDKVRITVPVVFGFNSLDSVSRSKGDYGGCHEIKVARTLDTSTQGPNKNQGGVAIIQKNNNISRIYDARGNGDGNVCPTLLRSSLEHISDFSPVCVSDGFSSSSGVDESVSIKDLGVRRLTPLECERLQGLPSVKCWDISKFNYGEFIALSIAENNIIVKSGLGKVFVNTENGVREVITKNVSGHKLMSIKRADVSFNCLVSHVVWISENGIIPDGYAVSFVNGNSLDTRIENLRLVQSDKNLSFNKIRIDSSISCTYRYRDSVKELLVSKYHFDSDKINDMTKDFGWTDIGEWSLDSNSRIFYSVDTNRYRAIGNGIALPFWRWVMERISKQFIGNVPTLGSLFDGIGSFPLIWSEINGAESCLWASEIDNFAIAVTKRNFD